MRLQAKNDKICQKVFLFCLLLGFVFIFNGKNRVMQGKGAIILSATGTSGFSVILGERCW